VYSQILVQQMRACELCGCRRMLLSTALVQDEFLSGRENWVGSGQQQDFAGTLKERRMLYQERRDVQGQESSRLIKRMREETGLENLDTDAAAPAAVRVLSCLNLPDRLQNGQFGRTKLSREPRCQCFRHHQRRESRPRRLERQENARSPAQLAQHSLEPLQKHPVC
jgi:hypothetical protein